MRQAKSLFGADGIHRFVGRIEIGIAQAVVDGVQPCGATVCQISHLNRGRFAGKKQQPVVRHVHGQINENIDLVRVNSVGKLFVGLTNNIMNVSGGVPETPRLGRIRFANGRICEDFKLLDDHVNSDSRGSRNGPIGVL